MVTNQVYARLIRCHHARGPSTNSAETVDVVHWQLRLSCLLKLASARENVCLVKYDSFDELSPYAGGSSWVLIAWSSNDALHTNCPRERRRVAETAASRAPEVIVRSPAVTTACSAPALGIERMCCWYSCCAGAACSARDKQTNCQRVAAKHPFRLHAMRRIRWMNTSSSSSSSSLPSPARTNVHNVMTLTKRRASEAVKQHTCTLLLLLLLPSGAWHAR